MDPNVLPGSAALLAAVVGAGVAVSGAVRSGRGVRLNIDKAAKLREAAKAAGADSSLANAIRAEELRLIAWSVAALKYPVTLAGVLFAGAGVAFILMAIFVAAAPVKYKDGARDLPDLSFLSLACLALAGASALVLGIAEVQRRKHVTASLEVDRPGESTEDSPVTGNTVPAGTTGANSCADTPTGATASQASNAKRWPFGRRAGRQR